MKKYLSLMLILALLATLFVTGTVLAQEPDPTEEAATEEVATDGQVAPTEEVTATVELTEEPTEESTVEPTEEVTPEPTEEVTEEPTVEPTEEATVEPTEEATVEPTIVVTPTLAAEGEIGASAVVGNWTSEYIMIQNLGTDSADATLTLYDYTGGVAGTISKDAIPVNGAVRITTNDTGFPGTGKYSGIISSDQPVAAAVMNINNTYKTGDAYLGFTSTSVGNVMRCPLILRGHSNWTSQFHIQDVSGSSQTVTVEAYRTGNSLPSASPTYPVPANSLVTVQLTSSAFDAFGSGTGAYGYAVIRGETGRNIAVVCNNIKDPNQGTSATVETNLAAFSSGSRDFIAPLVLNGHSNWSSGVSVVNIGSITTTVTFTYTLNPAYGGSVLVRTRDVGPGAQTSFYLPEVTPALPRPSYGAIAVHSSSADIIAGTTSTKYLNGAVAYTGPALNPANATFNVAVPLAFRLSNTSWLSGISVYSVGGAADITARFVRVDQDPTNPANVFTYTQAGVANGQVSFYTPEISGMLSNFVGTVYFESTVPIMSLATGTNYSSNISSQYPGYNY